MSSFNAEFKTTKPPPPFTHTHPPTHPLPSKHTRSPTQLGETMGQGEGKVRCRHGRQKDQADNEQLYEYITWHKA